MREEGSLVQIFASVSKEGEIHYHKESWDGPLVVPRRFHPSMLVKLIEVRNESPGSWEYEPDSWDLVYKAPKDEKINSYVLGENIHFGLNGHYSQTEPSPGPGNGGWSQKSGGFGGGSDKRLISVSYCSLSQKDLDKTNPQGNQ